MRRDDGQARQGGAAGATKAPGGDAGPSLQARARQVQALRARRADQRANAYNQAHPEACRELTQLTHGQLGSGGKVDLKALRAWQRAHGLAPDGCVGPKTLAAARAEAGARIDFSDDEATPVVVDADAAEGGLAEAIVDDGATGAMEAREAPNADEEHAESKEHASGGKEAIEHGLGEEAGGAASWLALVPEVVELLHEHHYQEAIAFVTKNVGVEKGVELLHEGAAKLAEHYGYELAPKLLGLLERAVVAGAVVDVLALGWEWTSQGLQAVAAAHERGERDSRISIYAYAWSDTVMGHRHQNPGAVGEEPRRAMELGIADGETTLALSPELGGLLLAEYHDPDNARRALEDALLKRAGFAGVKTHAGR
ncbi:MAG TPA: peptidoglycan-binding domain-containing protein [Polyangia bacterium]|nr:peptidoglycan-binding domain-containing protein [Polyangia bacterium]